MERDPQKTPHKLFSRAEVQLRNTREDLVIIYNDDVLNVTELLAEHPGGEKVLLDVAGTDATVQFDDIGHSSDAVAMMRKYRIGKLKLEDRIPDVNYDLMELPSLGAVYGGFFYTVNWNELLFVLVLCLTVVGIYKTYLE